jgi:cyclohexyl-isocyanide hydratase
MINDTFLDHPLTRRQFQRAAVLSVAALVGGRATPSGAATATTLASAPKPLSSGKEVIVMLMYPEMTALDFVAPQHFLSTLQGATIHQVAVGMKPIVSDAGMTLMPTMTLRDAPKQVDLLFVPGGTEGTVAAMRNDAILDFVSTRGKTAALVTSVCTGSMVLGAAGLLNGYKATSHWATRSLLPLFGATAVDQRYVRDRNRITGGGVTAGLDFGLMLVSELRGRPYAEAVQLLAEYDPKPPFAAGTPKTAPKAAVDLISSLLVDPLDQMREIAKTRRR